MKCVLCISYIRKWWDVQMWKVESVEFNKWLYMFWGEVGKVSCIGWIKYYYDKIAILRPKALRALPRITNTEITLASSTSIGSGSTQIFTPGSWVLNNNRLQNCITLEDTVMRPRCASWMTGTTVWTSCCWPTWTTPWGWWSYCPGSRPTLCRPPTPGGQQICLQLRPCQV